MSQTPVNILPRYENDKPQYSFTPSKPQCSFTSTAGSTMYKKYNQTSWIHDFDKDGKCSKDVVVEWMLEGNNWDLYTGNMTLKPGEVINQSVMSSRLRQVLIDRGHMPRSEKTIKETIRYLKKTFDATFATVNSPGFRVNPEVDGDKTIREKIIKLFKWYYDLLPLLGSEPHDTRVGSQTSESLIPELNAAGQPYHNDFQLTSPDDDNVDADDTAPVSVPVSTKQNRGEKRKVSEIISDYFEKQSDSSDNYALLLTAQECHLKQQMMIKKHEHVLKLRQELQREDIDDEDREEIRMFIEETKKDC
ncbi:hypothetical protein INT47_002657 [Mucor saturninus]|uniref:Uncharacterized protein n=1 Tax=Mucor saturninus TaxID=64648 RepID=A0A8H7R878_9FUNG|nr:hypothetical protein INT47_002657 [Mucor saturninus]